MNNLFFIFLSLLSVTGFAQSEISLGASGRFGNLNCLCSTLHFESLLGKYKL